MTLRRISLAEGADIEGFRLAVRRLIAAKARPHDVVWSASGEGSLLGAEMDGEAPPVAIPRQLGEWVELIVCHRDPERYALLYNLIWRVLHGERALLDVQSDPLVYRLARMQKSVRRDLHKMHAFLRFHRVVDPDGERFVAWFEPEHFIVEAAAKFFVERFRGLRWSILTPVGSLRWDGDALQLGPPATRGDSPAGDGFEAGWRSYYESIFNPARVNPTAMRSEMPKKYWHNMPETAAIRPLIRGADTRVRQMIEQVAAEPLKRDPVKAVAAMADQAPRDLVELNRIIAASEPLVPGATRAVLGEGPIGPALAFVGEQPGDQEDVEGHPFVGPAGQLLGRAFGEIGIERSKVYLTNAVKHFKFEQRGKRRIHQKPTAGEVKHYRWWLMKELGFVRPTLVVALGATATLALSGKSVPITKARGEADFGEWRGFVTVHPSYILRLPGLDDQQRAYEAFLSDLRAAMELAAALEAPLLRSAG